MWSSLWRPKSRDQRLLGDSLSTLLEPEACIASLCDSLHGGLPHAVADATQSEHDLHHACSVKPPSDRTEIELLEPRTRRRGSHIGNVGPSVVRD